MAFPLFILALIPLRELIKKYAFGADAPPADIEAANGDAAGGAKKEEVSDCDKTMTSVFQTVFNTKGIPGNDRSRYLEILDPLVKI